MKHIQSITTKLSRALVSTQKLAATSSLSIQPQLQSQSHPQHRTRTRTCRRTITHTRTINEQQKIQVPTMGDSITEGTVVEWTAAVGQAVKVDDVIVLIETDKVTIDIKAQVDGVVVEHFADVEDEVEVGSDLYMIDTEGVATATADTTTASSDPAAADTTETVDADNVAAAKPTKSGTGTRVPSIQFLGKVGWTHRLSVAGEATTPIPTIPMKPNGSVVLDGGPLPPMYGRLPFSEREMDDVLVGGASEAPYNY